MFSFDLTKQLPVVFVFLISGLFWSFGDAWHRSPFLSHAKRALYLWATSPLRKLVDNDIWSLSSVNAIVERSLPLHIVLVLAMSIRVINPFVSHMPMACFFDWAATLVGSDGAIYVRGRSLIHMSVEQCFLRRLCEENIGDSAHQSLSH